jgi:SAM-dependent methyltransferase
MGGDRTRHRGVLSSGTDRMLTIDYQLLGLEKGHKVLDLGCGAGRHSFESLRRGAHTVAADLDDAALKDVAAMFGALRETGEISETVSSSCVVADALRLPFDDGSFDRVIVSEVLEHVVHDAAALGEVGRVLKPGGRAAVTVPRWWPERLCWSLSDEYHSNEGGHVRIYRAGQLAARLDASGLRPAARHHAHALHSPYWWLKCAFDRDGSEARVASAYHRFLVWDLTTAARPVRTVERLLNPLMGKSLVMYADKPALSASRNGDHAGA